MKKLCMIVFNYYDIDSRVKRQAEFIAGAGWKVDIIALKSGFARNGRRPENIRLYEVPVLKQRGTFTRYVFQYTMFCLLSFFLVTWLHMIHRYSVIQIHTLPDFLVFSALVPRLFGCPILLDMHEITPEFFLSKYHVKKEHLIIRFITFIEKICIGFAHHVITVNESIRELLIGRGIPPEKISTIMDSADERLFVPHPQEKHTNNRFVLMYHGTLTQLYGIDVAIRSIAHISDEDRKKIHMKIAGEGPEEETLKKLTADLGLDSHVTFLGNHPLDEIPALIDECDAGICPTIQNELTEYSLSTKLLEYVHMEKPIVASKLKTYQKYFDESCLAFFTPGNEKECSEKILALASDHDLCKNLAHNAKERYRELGWSNIRDRYREILTRLAGKEEKEEKHKGHKE